MNGEASPAEATKLLKTHQSIFPGSQMQTRQVVDLSSKIVPSLRERAGYKAFIHSLETAYSLTQLAKEGNLKFIDVEGISSYGITPKIQIKTHQKSPGIRVLLRPLNKNDEKLYLGESYNQMPAPLALRDVSSWGIVKEQQLGKYRIHGRIGVPENQEISENPRALREFIDSNTSLFGITADTPVVEALCFLPIAATGEFITEFAPEMFMDIAALNQHKDWVFTVISQEKLLATSALMNDLERTPYSMEYANREILLPEADSKVQSNFRADFVLNMTDIEKLFVPDSAGHLIVIATPVKGPDRPQKQNDPFDFFGGLGLKGGFDGGATKSFTMGSASIGRVNLSRGRKAATSSLYEGDLQNSNEGESIIYHLSFLGVEPDQVNLVEQAYKGDNLNIVLDSFNNC